MSPFHDEHNWIVLRNRSKVKMVPRWPVAGQARAEWGSKIMDLGIVYNQSRLHYRFS